MSPALTTLLWFTCVCLVTLGIYVYIGDGTLGKNKNENEKEGFRSSRSIRITSCPSGTTSFVTSTGDTNCCSGEMQNGKCNGETVCSLSPRPPGGRIQTCSEIMSFLWDKRTSEWCPSNMYFYGTMDTRRPSGANIDVNIWGCSTSRPKLDGSKPEGTGLDFCTIYGSNVDDMSTVTTAAVAASGTTAAKPARVVSCLNMKQLQEMNTPTPTASRSMVNTSSSAKKTPALFNASFTPIKNASANPSPVTCTDWDRFRAYLQKSFPSALPAYDKIKGVHVYFCGAAKAYYVDGTLSASNALGVPSANSLPGLCPPPPPPAPSSQTSTAALPPVREYCANEVKRQVNEKIAEFRRNPLGTATNLGKAGLGAARNFFKRR